MDLLKVSDMFYDTYIYHIFNQVLYHYWNSHVSQRWDLYFIIKYDNALFSMMEVIWGERGSAKQKMFRFHWKLLEAISKVDV